MAKNSNLAFLLSNLESQVLDTLDSLSTPSEPPQIKYWFPSYVYESPALNTGDGLEGCGSFRGNDCKKEDSYVEDSLKEKEEILGVFGKEDETIADVGGGGFEDYGSFRGNDCKEEESYVEDSFKEKEKKLGVFGKEDENEKLTSKRVIKCEDSIADNGTSLVADSSETLYFRGKDYEDDGSYVEDSFKEKQENLGVFGNEDEIIADENVASEGFIRCEDSIANNDTNQDADSSEILFFRGNNCEEDGSYVEDSFKEYHKQENLVVFDNEDNIIADEKIASEGFIRHKDSIEVNIIQVAGSSDTLSLSSEPPDIKNWFSSYVYESPALDTSDEFRLFNLEETAQVGYNNGTSTIAKEDVWKFNRTGKTNDLVEDDNLDHQYKGKLEADGKRDSSAPTDMPAIGISEQILESESVQDHEDNAFKIVEISSLYDEGSTRIQKRKFPLESSHRPSGNNNENSPSKLIHRREFPENDGIVPPKSNLDLTARNENTKEDDGIHFAENGFVSARKNRSKRENDENFFIRPHRVHSESLRNGMEVSSVGNKTANLQRRALTEKTNTQPYDVLGVTGKWKCPQKSKPNRGPPTKQLRLERWVRRV